MTGTKAGGMQASATNKERYGKDFYANIGRIGGRNGNTGGFHYTKNIKCDCWDCVRFKTGFNKAQCAGHKGGLNSRRGPAKREEDE